MINCSLNLNRLWHRNSINIKTQLPGQARWRARRCAAYNMMGFMGPMGSMRPRVGRGWVAHPTAATHPGGATETTTETETTMETTETTNIPAPTTPQAPAPRDEISRSGHSSPFTLIIRYIFQKICFWHYDKKQCFQVFEKTILNQHILNNTNLFLLFVVGTKLLL